MDYSVLHDAEINMKVCSALGLGLSSYARIIRQDDATILLDDNKTLVDYCNNPADAWPIITENRIAIIPDSAEGEWVAFNEFTLYEGDWMFASDPAHHSNGKNPLRCAMESFLMMQESANVQDNPA